MIAVDAAHWWGPAGWLFRNTPGNLAASAIAFGAGFVAGRGPVRKLVAEAREHARWSAKHLAEVNAQVTGTPADEHPTLGQL